MQEYFFLLGIAFLWVVFAAIQDLKTTEVSNWLTFSLIAITLGYRAFYSSFSGDWMFFLYGVMGVGIFVILGYLFYYGRIFAGGDAKLLMGIGGVLPFEDLRSYLVLGGGFIILLFLCGLLWTLIYSIKIVNRNARMFKKEFIVLLSKNWIWLILIIVLGIILEFINYQALFFRGFIILSFIVLFFLYVYVKALDKSNMKVLKSWKDLMEGDWLLQDVRVRGKVIRKTVHGLSKEDIVFLRKMRRKVWVKEGIPFVPSFVLALVLFFILWIKEFFSLI